MNKRVISILLLLIAIVIGGAIVWRGTQKPTGPAKLNVGVILPLTGPSSFIGTSVKSGMEIAIQQFNATSEKPFMLQVDFSDTGGQPAKAVTAWQSLSASHSPQAFIAVQEGVKGLIPLADGDKRVLLATSVPDNGIAGANPWTFRFFINARTDAAAIANYAIEKLKKKSFAVIYINDSMGISYRESFSQSIKAGGGEVVSEQTFGPADTDFRAQVLRVKESNPDAVYLVGYGSSLSSIPLQLKENGINATLLSVGIISQPEIMKAAGSAVEGCYYTTSEFFTFAPATKELQSFVDAYKAKFSKVPVFFEVFGYDSLRLILNAATAGNSVNPESIRNAISQTKELPLAVGKVTMGSDGDAQFPVVVKMIKNGTWAPAEP